MEQILSLLFKEIETNPQINNTPYHKTPALFELSSYSEKNSEFYFLHQTKPREYFLLTYSLFNQTIKSKQKLAMTTQEITAMALHPINNDHLCLLGSSTLNIIKSLSEYTKDSSSSSQSIKEGSIYSLNFGKVPILQFNFSYYDYYFGVLLSNNTFIFDSITQHSTTNANQLPLSQSNVVSFNFLPLKSNGWDNFMIAFMKSDGAIFICGPLFPDQFTLDKEYILNMKESIAKKKLESPQRITDEDHFNEFLFQNIQEGIKNSFKTTVLIQSSEFMKKFNSSLILIHLQVGNCCDKGSCSGSDHNQSTYKQLFVLEGSPTAIIRISMKNTIDVMILAGELSPIRKESNKELKTLYHIETIDLLNQEQEVASSFSSKTKCIQINTSHKRYKDIILISGNNVYEIGIPYITQLKELLAGQSHHSHMVYQFESKVIQLISNPVSNNTSSSKKTNDIPLDYYFIDKILSHLVFITYINDQFAYGAIDLTDSFLGESGNVDEINTSISNSCSKKVNQEKESKSNKRLNPKQHSDNAKLIINRQQYDDDINEGEKGLANEFDNYSNDYKNIIPNIKDIQTEQMNHLLSMLNKSKALVNILQFKYNTYLTSLENISELTKDISAKRKTITKKMTKIASSLKKMAKIKGKATNAIIAHRMNIFRDQADELGFSIEAIEKSAITTKERFPIQLSSEVNVNGVTLDNMTNKDRFLNEIFCLKDKLNQIDNDMAYFNKVINK